MLLHGHALVFTVALALAILPAPGQALPRLRTAPEECPLQNGNLLDTVLFVKDGQKCQELCASREECLFFFYYPGGENAQENSVDATEQPAQCFMYDSCNRAVLRATDNCPLNRENTVSVHAFVRDESECEESCVSDDNCGYFRHFGDDDEKQPNMCYLLKSCSPRIIRNQECPIEPNNYIDHTLFTRNNEACRQKCEDTAGCRFFYWYPIDYSPAPRYCYLFRNCQGGAGEPTVALIVAGRHPGHYFLDQEESLDLIRAGTVCEKSIEAANDTTSSVGRAGSTAEFLGTSAYLCGGRDHNGAVLADCLSYDTKNNEWQAFQALQSPREEAASLVMNDEVIYIMGGFVDGQRTDTAEMYSFGDDGDSAWNNGPNMAEPRSRFCAVAVSDTMLAVLGGETADDVLATPDLKMYSTESQEWTTEPEMRQQRKDHACVMAEVDGQKGILVTGGVDEDDNLLNSAEFYSLETESWIELSPLKSGRTEHGMALVSGQPTVIGGVSDDEFLSSVEVLDNSADAEATPLGLDWRTAAHVLTRPRYDFAIAAVPLGALPNNERSMEMCYDDEEAVVTGAEGFL